MASNRDNPLVRFAAFWWGAGVIALFFVILFAVRLAAGGGDALDPLEHAAAIQRYETRAKVDASQDSNLDWKVVEEGAVVQVPPHAAFEMVGRQLVASQPTKVDDPAWVVPGSAAAEALAAAPSGDFGAVDAMTPAAGTQPDPGVMAAGQAAYAVCLACHGPTGEGGPIAPPLAASDWVNGPVSNLIRIQLRGLMGPITVSGKEYNLPAPMAPLAYQTDEQIAAVLTYIRNSFGNSAPPVLPEQVAALRSEAGKPMLTVEELLPPTQDQ